MFTYTLLDDSDYQEKKNVKLRRTKKLAFAAGAFAMCVASSQLILAVGNILYFNQSADVFTAYDRLWIIRHNWVLCVDPNTLPLTLLLGLLGWRFWQGKVAFIVAVFVALSYLIQLNGINT